MGDGCFSPTSTEFSRKRNGSKDYFDGIRIFLIVFVFMAVVAADCYQARGQEARQAAFERVFGDKARFTGTIMKAVRDGSSGRYHYRDSDGDGRRDEAWFIDTHERHTESVQPLLVRAVDEDGDLPSTGAPDQDSDLYLADWNANGGVDAAVDYHDEDGDGDVDEMAIYFWLPRHRYFGENALGVWWSRDDGDDNRLWYDVNYRYYQRLCQYRCDFNGDETFVAFALPPDATEWVSGWENPFLFYDADGDELSEVVLRVEGLADQVRAIRYSFDVDNDNSSAHRHDYDFSITAVADADAGKAGRGQRALALPKEAMASTVLRGIPTQAWLSRERARDVVVSLPWDRALLTWDELNANTEADVERDPNERWEGVIARGNEEFPQVGGPPCSRFNKRNELALKGSAPFRFYYSRSDRRWHLSGASKGWLWVDYDLDGSCDMKYRYRDSDGDGLFNRRTLDLNADETVEFEWEMLNEERMLDPEFEALHGPYVRRLKEGTRATEEFIAAAKAALGSTDERATAVERFYEMQLEHWMAEAGLGIRIQQSPAGKRYYRGLIRDLLFWALAREFQHHDSWGDVERFYSRGAFGKAANQLATLNR